MAAQSEEIAEAALELIDVEYEELEPLLDPLAAVKSTADLASSQRAILPGPAARNKSPSNVFVDMTWNKGLVDAGFRAADVIIENTFTTHPALRPHRAAFLLGVGECFRGAEVWACSKVPFALREQVATAFRRPAGIFSCAPVTLGCCFGGKGDFMDVPCVICFRSSGRPVKDGDGLCGGFIAVTPRHAAVSKVKTA